MKDISEEDGVTIVVALKMHGATSNCSGGEILSKTLDGKGGGGGMTSYNLNMNLLWKMWQFAPESW